MNASTAGSLGTGLLNVQTSKTTDAECQNCCELLELRDDA